MNGLFVFFLLVVIKAAILLPKTTNDFKNCVGKVTAGKFSSEKNMILLWDSIYPDITFGGAKTLINATYKTMPDYSKYRKHDSYILAVNELNLNETLVILKGIYGWNSRAKFFFIYEGNLEMLFKAVSKYFIYNVIVLKVDEMNLYTYHPYRYENFNEPDFKAFLISSCEKYSADDFMEKIPKLWRNSTVRIAYMHLYPFIICAECGTGLEIQVVALMRWYFQFKIKYSGITYKDWGLLINGVYTGAIGDAYKGIADFVIGHFHLREEERVIDFDTSFYYMDDDVCWTVPMANLRSHWDNIMRIFTKTLWISFAVTLTISTLSWYYISKLSREDHVSRLSSIEAIYANLLGLPLTREPKSTSMKLLFVSFWLFFFVITTLWKAYLIDSLTYKRYGYQISTLKQLTESNLILGIYTELRDLHGAEGTLEGDYVYNHADPNLCDASHDCLDRTAFKRDMATIATIRMYAYLIPQRYRTLTGRDTLYVFKKALAKDYTVQYYTKGHPLFEKANEFLMWFRTSGFMDHIDNQLKHELALANQKYMATIPTFETKVLSMAETWAIFVLLLSGLGVGFVCFLCELGWFRWRKRDSI